MHTVSSSTERDPLLNRPEGAKVPYGQFALLALCRTAHPLCFGFILPWIAPLLVKTGIATQASVGWYAGWVESAYSASFIVGLVPAVTLSDCIGRKKTVLIGLAGAAAGSACFGLAEQLWQLVALRICLGFFIAFIPASVATMLIEKSTRESQALCFAASALGWQTGCMLAPILGGTFADPASTWPHVFTGIWVERPYFLPGLVVACFVAVIALLASFGVVETLSGEKRQSLRSRFGSNGQVSAAPLRDMFTPEVCLMLSLWFCMVGVNLIGIAQEVLFFYTPTSLGGLQLSTKGMAVVWSMRPPMMAFFEGIIYPILARRWSPEMVLKIGAAGQPLLYAVYFFLGIHARSGGSQASVFAVLGLYSLLQTSMNPMYLACTQLLAQRAPSKAFLTRINTASEFAANLGHGVGAFTGSNWFHFVVESQFLGGTATWLLPMLLSSLVFVMTLHVVPKDGWREREEEIAETQ